ncbi:MAG: hypothetical protein HQL54_05455 [Magnetococcales bacterium]|nr:hypothetical protein [Magnetococcales bacterium]
MGIIVQHCGLPEHESARKKADMPSDDPLVNALVRACHWDKMLDNVKSELSWGYD